MTNLNIKTMINGKKVIGIAGLIAFLEDGKFVYLTNEKILNEDFCDETFKITKENIFNSPTKENIINYDKPDSNKYKDSNYRGKNFNPDYKTNRVTKDKMVDEDIYQKMVENIDKVEVVGKVKEVREEKIINSTTKLVKKIKTQEELDSEEFKKQLDYSGTIRKI
jgi:hypothetical protein